MNKTQLIDALAARIGDRRTASTAVDGLLETIVDTVGAGESVSLTGFGVFESRARAARVARNPRTGETVDVPATTVPAFRPGAGFRTKVGGGGAPAPRTTPVRRSRAVAEVLAAAEPARKSAKAKAKADATFAAAKRDPAPAEKVPAEKTGKNKAAKSADDKPKKVKAKK